MFISSLRKVLSELKVLPIVFWLQCHNPMVKCTKHLLAVALQSLCGTDRIWIKTITHVEGCRAIVLRELTRINTTCMPFACMASDALENNSSFCCQRTDARNEEIISWISR